MELVRAAAQGRALHQLIPDLPACAAASISRHAPIATRINDFDVKLHSEHRSARYPRDEVEALLRTATAWQGPAARRFRGRPNDRRGRPAR
jgi:hypothetical protein